MKEIIYSTLRNSTRRDACMKAGLKRGPRKGDPERKRDRKDGTQQEETGNFTCSKREVSTNNGSELSTWKNISQPKKELLRKEMGNWSKKKKGNPGGGNLTKRSIA